MNHRYTATVRWEWDGESFSDLRYSRAHRWAFDGGLDLPASSSPQVVRPPMSDPAAVDPEEAFVAALSSCHMLFFLSLAARAGYVVERYTDEAVGTMGRDDRGRVAMVRVSLRPRIEYAGRAPGDDEAREIHHQAHEQCYLASSVSTDVVVEPPAVAAPEPAHAPG